MILEYQKIKQKENKKKKGKRVKIMYARKLEKTLRL